MLPRTNRGSGVTVVTNDVVMIVTNGTIFSQTVQNTFFYRCTVNGSLTTGWFPEFLQEWWDNVYLYYFDVTMRGQYNTGIVWESVKGENLMQADEIGGYQPLLPVGGTSSASNALAQFNAYGWTQPSGMRGMNSGKRRVSGVSEGNVGMYGIVEAVTATVLDTQASRFSEDFNLIGTTATFDIDITPVIVKRVRSGTGQPTSPFKYRLPRTQAEAVTYPAKSWSADRYITTQNSRKTGRGM